jgi:hypothetical protein
MSRLVLAAMQNVRSSRFGQAALAATLSLMLSALPAAALDLLARHQVSVQFATPDGKPMGGAEVRVFAPGDPVQPALSGHTDNAGKFEFSANEDGFWSAEARGGGEIARVTVRVGSFTPGQQSEPPSLYWLVGGLVLLLALAFGVRIIRIRTRRLAGKP